jgi:putative ATP-dependent endonuclease of OLD family
METGAKSSEGTSHSAPFQHQGTGTINVLVLALLSQIAELKQNVIFAMEEPEIAIPPHTQKRIVDSIRQRSAQVIFTSHSPYVLEEFDPANVLVLRRENGTLHCVPTTLPPTVKPKTYRSEFRTRFCEALLARRVLIVEGRTEYDAIPAAARRLHELHPTEFRTLETLGIAIVDARTDSQVKPLGEYFNSLGKQVFAVFDRQTPVVKRAIEAIIPNSFEVPEHGFEELMLNQCAETALRRHALQIVTDGDWPPHLALRTPTAATLLAELRSALHEYLKCNKGSGGAAELIGSCFRDEMPTFVVETLLRIQRIAEPAPPATATAEPDITAG